MTRENTELCDYNIEARRRWTPAACRPAATCGILTSMLRWWVTCTALILGTVASTSGLHVEIRPSRDKPGSSLGGFDIDVGRASVTLGALVPVFGASIVRGQGKTGVLREHGIADDGDHVGCVVPSMRLIVHVIVSATIRSPWR